MEPVHVAITRLVRPGKDAEFERAMYAFIERSIGVHGVTGVHLLRPAPGADSREYGILRSFESREARDDFYASKLFADWEEEVAPLVESGCGKRELHGLEAFFRRGAAGAPPRWKMALLTWMGVFPSVVIWSAVLRPPLRELPSVATTAVITGFVVLTLAWGVMPMLTRVAAGGQCSAQGGEVETVAAAPSKLQHHAPVTGHVPPGVAQGGNALAHDAIAEARVERFGPGILHGHIEHAPRHAQVPGLFVQVMEESSADPATAKIGSHADIRHIGRAPVNGHFDDLPHFERANHDARRGPDPVTRHDMGQVRRGEAQGAGTPKARRHRHHFARHLHHPVQPPRHAPAARREAPGDKALRRTAPRVRKDIVESIGACAQD